MSRQAYFACSFAAFVVCVTTAAAVPQQIDPLWSYPINGSSTGGRVTANDVAAFFVAEWPEGLGEHCSVLNAISLSSGQLLWQSCLPACQSWQNTMPPSASEDHIAVAGQGGEELCVFNARTGDLLWSLKSGDWNMTWFEVANGPRVLPNRGGVLISSYTDTMLLDVETGVPKWISKKWAAFPTFSSYLAYTSEFVLIQSWLIADKGNALAVVALNMSTGHLEWTSVLPMTEKERRGGKNFNIYDEHVDEATLALLVSYGTTLSGFSIRDRGRVLYNHTLHASWIFDAPYLSVAEGRVVTHTLTPQGAPGMGYFNVTAMATTTGATLWTAGPYLGLNEPSLAAGIMPAVSRRTVVFADLNAIVALDAATGAVKWTSAPYYTSPENQLFAFSPNGKFAVTIYCPVEYQPFVLAAFPL